MARLIKANDLIERMKKEAGFSLTSADVIDIIESTPTVDAVEVVRCKSCKYFEKMNSNNTHFCNEFGGNVEENDYCSRSKLNEKRGERWLLR